MKLKSVIAISWLSLLGVIALVTFIVTWPLSLVVTLSISAIVLTGWAVAEVFD
jgi:hypothetical protein